MDSTERERRINDYFKIVSTLEKNQCRKLREEDFLILEQMSEKKGRLWCITGCGMAQEIEKEFGTQTLPQFVKQSFLGFFENYINLKNHHHTD